MTRTNHHWIRTGRTDTRKLCAACEARIMYGDPKPSNTWDARLRLSQEMLSLLLVAAAEFDMARRNCTCDVVALDLDLNEEQCDCSASEPDLEANRSVDFVDWITETALGQTVIRSDHDGAPGRLESGGFAQHKHYRHRHPDPLPVVVLPQSWRKSAS